MNIICILGKDKLYTGQARDRVEKINTVTKITDFMKKIVPFKSRAYAYGLYSEGEAITQLKGLSERSYSKEKNR